MSTDSIEFLNFIPDHAQEHLYPLYYSKPYLDQLETKILSFSAVKRSTSQVLIVIHFQIVNEHAKSLVEAPFGGLCKFGSSDSQDIEAFMQYIVNELKSKGICQITIKTAPVVYNTFCSSDQTALKNTGFVRHATEINHHLVITQDSPTLQFSAMQRRRLSKCIQANFRFAKEEPARLEPVYHFISDCRKEKGHSVSMSYEKLNKMAKSLPDSYLIFTCYDGAELIAASICVVVSPKVLYHFLPSSKTSYNTYSPMVFLISNLYNYCQENGFYILDLGTSMRGTKTNDGLATFKTRIGGISTQRDIYGLCKE